MIIVRWIVIGVLILMGLWYLKVEHHARKIKIIVIFAVGALLYFSMLGIFSSNEIDLTSPREIVNSIYIYFGWIGQTSSNLWNIGTDTVTLVGSAIKINNTDYDRKPK